MRFATIRFGLLSFLSCLLLVPPALAGEVCFGDADCCYSRPSNTIGSCRVNRNDWMKSYCGGVAPVSSHVTSSGKCGRCGTTIMQVNCPGSTSTPTAQPAAAAEDAYTTLRVFCKDKDGDSRGHTDLHRTGGSCGEAKSRATSGANSRDVCTYQPDRTDLSRMEDTSKSRVFLQTNKCPGG